MDILEHVERNFQGRMIQRLRDQLIPDGVNFFVMEAAGSSCLCI